MKTIIITSQSEVIYIEECPYCSHRTRVSGDQFYDNICDYCKKKFEVKFDLESNKFNLYSMEAK